MFIEHLKIAEDGFYFRGLILLTCLKKRDTGHVGFHGKLSNFHNIVKYVQRYVKYIEGNHCIVPFSIFKHCFINFELQYFQ